MISPPPFISFSPFTCIFLRMPRSTPEEKAAIEVAQALLGSMAQHPPIGFFCCHILKLDMIKKVRKFIISPFIKFSRLQNRYHIALYHIFRRIKKKKVYHIRFIIFYDKM